MSVTSTLIANEMVSFPSAKTLRIRRFVGTLRIVHQPDLEGMRVVSKTGNVPVELIHDWLTIDTIATSSASSVSKEPSLTVFVPTGARIEANGSGGTIAMVGDIDGVLIVRSVEPVRILCDGRLLEADIRPQGRNVIVALKEVTRQLIVELVDPACFVGVLSGSTESAIISVGSNCGFKHEGTITGTASLKAYGGSIAIDKLPGRVNINVKSHEGVIQVAGQDL